MCRKESLRGTRATTPKRLQTLDLPLNKVTRLLKIFWGRCTSAAKAFLLIMVEHLGGTARRQRKEIL